jgi:Yip1 domain
MWRNLATIMIRPRATMRRILDGGRDRAVLPLILLVLLAGLINDLDVKEAQRISSLSGPMIALIAAGVLIGMTLITIVLFYAVTWTAYMIGRFLEGTGTVRDVRSAMAWGLSPVVWSLLYAIPLALFSPRSRAAGLNMEDGGWRFTQGNPMTGCGLALLIAVLELTTIIWSIVTTSHTLGEAHRFSSVRGFATLCVLLVLPAVITLAAALTMAF